MSRNPERLRFSWIYVAFKISDERGTKGDCLGVCSKEVDAKLLAKGQGFYGGDGIVENRHAVVQDTENGCLVHIIENRHEIVLDRHVSETRDKARNAALSKLTKEERDVLGLPDPPGPVEVYDRT